MSPEAREPYETLAGAYDGLTTDVDYAAVLQFFETVLQRAGHSPKTVLDLACGTGSMSVLLAERGYRVIGADISEEMLTAAAQKAAAMAENPPFFICQPMQRLTLPEPVEAIVCLLDSLNYLTEPEDCRKTFHRVWRALRPGGMFFFDINTPQKLRGLDGQVFLDETEDAYCVWRAEYSRRRRVCSYFMDIFRLEEESGLWERGEELHEERAYTPEELTSYLRDAGFTQIKQYGNLKHRPPKPGEDRIFFTARKEV